MKGRASSLGRLFLIHYIHVAVALFVSLCLESIIVRWILQIGLVVQLLVESPLATSTRLYNERVRRQDVNGRLTGTMAHPIPCFAAEETSPALRQGLPCYSKLSHAVRLVVALMVSLHDTFWCLQLR